MNVNTSVPNNHQKSEQTSHTNNYLVYNNNDKTNTNYFKGDINKNGDVINHYDDNDNIKYI